jgi:hypothetical protein
MRLTAAFLANRAEVVDGMLNVQGGFWASTTVAPGSGGFKCQIVVLCEMDANDLGKQFSLLIDAQGPSGHWARAQSSDFTINSPMMFLCSPPTVLPIEPDGGPHIYTLRLDGQHERVDVPLDVRLARA